MRYEETYNKRKGNLIWFGESEDTADIVGIVIGFNNQGLILLVTHGEGDYLLNDSDTIPDKLDRINDQGYVLNDLDGIEFDY